MQDLILLVIGALLSIPVSILANIYTPKVQAWLAYRSANSIKGRITKLQQLIDETERLTRDQCFAIAKFTNIQHRANAQIMLLMSVMIIGSIIFIRFPNPPVPSPEPSFSLSAIISGFILGSGLAYAMSGKTLELYAMTYRVEKFQQWKAKTNDEILNLKQELRKYN